VSAYLLSWRFRTAPRRAICTVSSQREVLGSIDVLSERVLQGDELIGSRPGMHEMVEALLIDHTGRAPAADVVDTVVQAFHGADRIECDDLDRVLAHGVTQSLFNPTQEEAST
jgi:hypothetical protein